MMKVFFFLLRKSMNRKKFSEVTPRYPVSVYSCSKGLLSGQCRLRFYTDRRYVNFRYDLISTSVNN